MGDHRSPKELLDAKKAELVALELKVARQELAQHPEILDIESEISEIQKSIVTARRHEKEAPEKIQAFTDKVAEWTRRGEQAVTDIEDANSEIQDLRLKRNNILQTLIGTQSSNQA